MSIGPVAGPVLAVTAASMALSFVPLLPSLLTLGMMRRGLNHSTKLRSSAQLLCSEYGTCSNTRQHQVKEAHPSVLLGAKLLAAAPHVWGSAK